MPQAEDPKLEVERKRFEDKAFNKRFIMSVRKVGDGPFAMQSVGCPTMEEFVKRRPDGDYEDDTLNAMWWAWQTALKPSTPKVPLAVVIKSDGELILARTQHPLPPEGSALFVGEL